MSGHLTFAEAIVVGALQGAAELFPVSSLGHSVLLPALVGGGWAADLNVSAPESPYLAFIVGLHVATALALVLYFWRDWVRIVTGFVTSIRYRRVHTADERLAWMIILATIPVGIAGLALEHTFRTVLGRPVPAAIFLIVNGGILYGAERLRRRAAATTLPPAPALETGLSRRAAIRRAEPDWSADRSGTAAGFASSSSAPSSSASSSAPPADDAPTGATDPVASDARVAARSFIQTTLIGAAQILALLPGISRSGVTMAAGLRSGLSHEDSARFAFLLATPVILAAGALKVPDLFGPLGKGIHGQVLAGSVASFVCAYLAVRFLTRYFETRTLTPFAIYCAAAGAVSLAWLGLR
ncbi:undecaprenyl-diphosphate phosphatase [Rugosimonospora africana]|uniref:Undecaprenyl-diphosphatase n=1 Tax=Rugosimonospora africana TaxID=556532 RepID=A0A8J3QUR7_9ACTN|nr:undecaprenyl-diphosphate phosphatase [Rugosimonospora africana]GIH16472.1 undecaprenyl-diphosphatase [Rugosimonospora africana]